MFRTKKRLLSIGYFIVPLHPPSSFRNSFMYVINVFQGYTACKCLDLVTSSELMTDLLRDFRSLFYVIGCCERCSVETTVSSERTVWTLTTDQFLNPKRWKLCTKHTESHLRGPAQENVNSHEILS